MRELTGYEDKHGRPILEGDIVVSHAGEINVVEEIPEGWYPLCSFEAHEIASIEVLSALIRSRYPTATFHVSPDMDDPDITILWTTVDIDDTDQVLDWVCECQFQWQLEEGVTVYVVPIRPPARSKKL